mmetsp:Transcript_26256/g.40268  ORF Transcript_26256/g.40268 Transcript_26256/m.40268 type:complete len:521 (-) Transcript_26256:312-1874(-)
MFPYRALQKTTTLSPSPSLRRLLLWHHRSPFSTITSSKYGPPLLYTPKVGPYHPIINAFITISGALCVLYGFKSSCETEEHYHIEKKAIDWGRQNIVEVKNEEEQSASGAIYDLYGTEIPGRPILDNQNNGRLVLVRGLVKPAKMHHHGKRFGELQQLVDDTEFNLRRNNMQESHARDGSTFVLPDTKFPLLKLHRNVERYRWEEVFAGINISPYYYQDWSYVHDDSELFGNSAMCWFHLLSNNDNRIDHRHQHLESKTFTCDSMDVSAAVRDSTESRPRHPPSSSPTSFLLKSEISKHISPDKRVISNELPKLSRCTTWPNPLALPLAELSHQPIWSQNINAFLLPDGNGHFVLPAKTDGSAPKPIGSLFWRKEPQIGDQRVYFNVVPPMVCSILAKQTSGGHLVPYILNSSNFSLSMPTSATTIDLVRVQPGYLPNAQIMFDYMEDVSKESRRHGHLESSVMSILGSYFLLNGTVSSPSGTFLMHHGIPCLYKVPFSISIALLNVGLSKIRYCQHAEP